MILKRVDCAQPTADDSCKSSAIVAHYATLTFTASGLPMRRVTAAPAFTPQAPIRPLQSSLSSSQTSGSASAGISGSSQSPLVYALKVAQEYAYDLVASRLGVRMRPHSRSQRTTPKRKPPVALPPALMPTPAAGEPRVYYACVERDGFLVESGALFKLMADAPLNCPYEVQFHFVQYTRTVLSF